MEKPNESYKVFINSDFRQKSYEKSSNFIFYAQPALTGISRVKVNSIAVPMSQFTFAGLSEEQRTFESYARSNTHVDRFAKVIFQQNRNYTRTEFVSELNKAYLAAGYQVTVSADAHNGTAIEFVSDETYQMAVVKFPQMKSGLSLPALIPAAGGTLPSGSQYLHYDSQVAKTFPNIAKLVLTHSGAQETVTPLLLSATTYTPASLQSALQGAFGAIGTWAVSSSTAAASITLVIPAQSDESTIQLDVYDHLDEIVSHNRMNILSGDPQTVPAGAVMTLTFSQHCVFHNQLVFPSEYNDGAMPKVTFKVNHVYNVEQLVSDYNTAFGTTVATKVNDNIYRIANPSSTGALLFKKNEDLGITEDTKIGISANHDFTINDFTHASAPLHTGALDFGSGVSKCSYLAIPNLITSSRCSSGHRSIITSVINSSTEIFGSYAQRTDDSGIYHITSKSEIDQLEIVILDENMKEAEIGELPVFIELSFLS